VISGPGATAQLNSALQSVTQSIPGASFANPEPVFNPAGAAGKSETGDIPTICLFTGMCPGGTYNPASPSADIHPTTLGHAALAGFVTASFLTH
jgi:hypothetical protein